MMRSLMMFYQTHPPPRISTPQAPARGGGFHRARAFEFPRFGTNCQGNILHNYSPHDTWATVSRVAMLLATICGFPIAFTGERSSSGGGGSGWNSYGRCFPRGGAVSWMGV